MTETSPNVKISPAGRAYLTKSQKRSVAKIMREGKTPVTQILKDWKISIVTLGRICKVRGITVSSVSRKGHVHLTRQQKARVRVDFKAGLTVKKLSKKYGPSEITIRKIVKSVRASSVQKPNVIVSKKKVESSEFI